METATQSEIDISNIDINEVKKYLPHRYPFLMVDKVIEAVPGESIVGIKNVTVNEPFFMGHFPASPVLPGVLMIEALAQVSGILTFVTLGRYRYEEELYYLAGVDNARFKRMVVPGDQLRLEVNVLKMRRDLWKLEGRALVDGELACSAEFMNVRGRD